MFVCVLILNWKVLSHSSAIPGLWKEKMLFSFNNRCKITIIFLNVCMLLLRLWGKKLDFNLHQGFVYNSVVLFQRRVTSPGNENDLWNLWQYSYLLEIISLGKIIIGNTERESMSVNWSAFNYKNDIPFSEIWPSKAKLFLQV